MRISYWSSDVCSSDLSLTYQHTKEFRPSPYDDRAQNVVLTSHWYDIDNVTKNTSLQLFSDWTMDFSTEVKLSQQTFDQINGNAINQPDRKSTRLNSSH